MEMSSMKLRVKSDGKKYVVVTDGWGHSAKARCHPDDEFDLAKGMSIATDRFIEKIDLNSEKPEKREANDIYFYVDSTGNVRSDDKKQFPLMYAKRSSIKNAFKNKRDAEKAAREIKRFLRHRNDGPRKIWIPKEGMEFYLPAIRYERTDGRRKVAPDWTKAFWKGSDMDFANCIAGAVFRTQENAIKAARMMIKAVANARK